MRLERGEAEEQGREETKNAACRQAGREAATAQRVQPLQTRERSTSCLVAPALAVPSLLPRPGHARVSLPPAAHAQLTRPRRPRQAHPPQQLMLHTLGGWQGFM